jgi:hypothetical protein
MGGIIFIASSLLGYSIFFLLNISTSHKTDNAGSVQAITGGFLARAFGARALKKSVCEWRSVGLYNHTHITRIIRPEGLIME